MDQSKWSEIDRQLEALGPAPDSTELLARNLPERITLASADAWLAELGQGMSTSLLQTQLDVPAPRVPDEALRVDAPAAPQMQPAPVSSAPVSSAEPSHAAPAAADEAAGSDAAAVARAVVTTQPSALMFAEDTLPDRQPQARSPFASEPPVGRPAFPWESDLPPRLPEAEVDFAPAPPASPASPAPTEAPAASAAAAPRPRRDTVEQPAFVRPRLDDLDPFAPDEPNASNEPDAARQAASIPDVLVDAAPAQADAAVHADAEQAANDGPATTDAPRAAHASDAADAHAADADAATDEFEIMVDDDILEIDDGDVEVVDDDDES